MASQTKWEAGSSNFAGSAVPRGQLRIGRKRAEWEISVLSLECFCSVLKNAKDNDDEKKQFEIRKVSFFMSECDFKYGLFRDCLWNFSGSLSQQSTLTSEACIWNPWVCTWVLSGCQCLCLHTAPVTGRWCLILCSYLLLSIKALMGRCCQGYHANQRLWLCCIPRRAVDGALAPVLLHNTF